MTDTEAAVATFFDEYERATASLDLAFLQKAYAETFMFLSPGSVQSVKLEDFLREIFLDKHLDNYAVIAAQTADKIAEEMVDHHVDVAAAQKLIDKATELLTPEQKTLRDDIIKRREDNERRRAEEESRELAQAEAEAEAMATEAANLMIDEGKPPQPG